MENSDEVGALDRITRVIAFSIGAAGVLFLLITNPLMPAQLALGRWWFHVVGLLAIAMPVVLLTVGAFTAPLRWVRATAGWLAIGQLTVLALIPLGYPRGIFTPDDGWPWELAITAPCIMATALAWRSRSLIWYIPTFAVLLAAAIPWLLGAFDPIRMFRGTAGQATLGLLFTMVAIGARAGGTALDAETRRLRSAAAARAETSASVVERARVDGLVHDNVLAALLAVGRGARSTTLIHSLERARDALRELAAPPEYAGQLSAQEAAARLRHACADLDDAATVTVQCSDSTLRIGTAVVHALQEVTAEALRNSLRHAGAPDRVVTRSVDITVGPSVSIAVRDNGIGFDVANVSPRRLGIAVGIRGRLARIPRATLTIESALGTGTLIAASVPIQISGADHVPLGPETETVSKAVTAPDIMGLHSGIAAAMGAAFVLSESLRPFESVRNGVVNASFLAALVALFSGLAILLLPGPDPMPRGRSWVMTGCVVAAALFNVAAVKDFAMLSQTAFWSWPPATILMAFMAVRGRFLAAWCGFAGSAAIFSTWIAENGTPFTGSFISQLMWNLMVLVVCSLFARSHRRQVDLINATAARTLALAEERGRAQASLRERDQQLSYLDLTARPLLEHLATIPEPDDDMRLTALLVEARLRDRIRARALATEPILDAAQSARTRGIDVVLLDDGALDDADAATCTHVRETVLGHLDATRAGRLTARIMPPGRDSVCTITHQDGDEHAYASIRAPHAHRTLSTEPSNLDSASVL